MMADVSGENSVPESTSVKDLFTELFGSPVNIALLSICFYLVYKIFCAKKGSKEPLPEPELPHLPQQDLTLEQIKEYNGKGEDGRILIAVNGKVFDVTKGKRFYGPDGPYGCFAGRDASRGLATFSLTEENIKDEYDDLSDMNAMQMESIMEWQLQFQEKYVYVGKLLKPGEKATEYSDAEDTPAESSSEDKKTL